MAILQPWHLQFTARFDNETNQKIARSTEAIIVEEMGLDTITDSSVNPDPREQGLEAYQLVDYSFSVAVDGPLLVLPVGPLTDITALSVDGDAVDLARLQVAPWTIRHRDASTFKCGSTVTISGTVGWSDPTEIPHRIKSAADLLSAYIAEWYDRNATVINESVGDSLSRTYAPPSRDRVHDLIGSLVSPWSRPQIF